MGKTRSLCFPRAVPNFVTDSRIAGTEYVSARAGENSPTYGVYPPRPHPSLYPVYHPVNVTPACFAVNEFNKETNAKLHIVRVVAALEELRCGYFRQLLTLEYPRTYGVSPPPPRQSPYYVDHPVNRAPARFSVDEFNKEADAKLHLVRVVVALEQPRWGYFHQLLTLEVGDEDVAKIYDADVKTKFGSSDMRLVSFREDAYFVADSTIASTAASDTGSTLMCDPDYLLARAIEKLPTYGFLFPRPRPSPYPVDHHLIMAPARFAVDEINKEKNANLHLVRVVAAFDRRSFEYFTQQLRLEVLDEGMAKIYGAEVKRKSGSSDMRLVVFYEVGNPS
ncbi:hypothetical protein ACFX11_015494 [Malus domestica]